jgi:hypothetical protein
MKEESEEEYHLKGRLYTKRYLIRMKLETIERYLNIKNLTEKQREQLEEQKEIKLNQKIIHIKELTDLKNSFQNIINDEIEYINLSTVDLKLKYNEYLKIIKEHYKINIDTEDEFKLIHMKDETLLQRLIIFKKDFPNDNIEGLDDFILEIEENIRQNKKWIIDKNKVFTKIYKRNLDIERPNLDDVIISTEFNQDITEEIVDMNIITYLQIIKDKIKNNTYTLNDLNELLILLRTKYLEAKEKNPEESLEFRNFNPLGLNENEEDYEFTDEFIIMNLDVSNVKKINYILKIFLTEDNQYFFFSNPVQKSNITPLQNTNFKARKKLKTLSKEEKKLVEEKHKVKFTDKDYNVSGIENILKFFSAALKTVELEKEKDIYNIVDIDGVSYNKRYIYTILYNVRIAKRVIIDEEYEQQAYSSHSNAIADVNWEKIIQSVLASDLINDEFLVPYSGEITFGIGSKRKIETDFFTIYKTEIFDLINGGCINENFKDTLICNYIFDKREGYVYFPGHSKYNDCLFDTINTISTIFIDPKKTKTKFGLQRDDCFPLSYIPNLCEEYQINIILVYYLSIRVEKYMGTENIESPKYNFVLVIDLFENHFGAFIDKKYYKVNEKLKEIKMRKFYLEKISTNRNKMNIIYDIETIKGLDFKHYSYLIQYKILADDELETYDWDLYKDKYLEEVVCLFDLNPLKKHNKVIKSFVKILFKYSRSYDIKLISFNGSGYDDLFVLSIFYKDMLKNIKDLMLNDEIEKTLHEPYILLVRQRILKIVYRNIEGWDLFNHVRGSLKDAGESFNAKPQKQTELINHEEIQYWISKGIFKEKFLENKDKIIKYGKYDVLTTESVLVNYRKFVINTPILQDNSGKILRDPLNFITFASMINDYYNNLIDENNVERPKSLEDYKLLKNTSAGMVAILGRTGKNKWCENIRIYDMTSQYPYVCLKSSRGGGWFPCGKYYKIKGNEFDENKLGFFLCKINQTKLRAPLIPEKTEKGNNFQTQTEIIKGYITTCGINYLRKRWKCEIEIIEGIQFEDKTQLLNDYMETFKVLKEEQDKLKWLKNDEKREIRYRQQLLDKNVIYNDDEWNNLTKLQKEKIYEKNKITTYDLTFRSYLKLVLNIITGLASKRLYPTKYTFKQSTDMINIEIEDVKTNYFRKAKTPQVIIGAFIYEYARIEIHEIMEVCKAIYGDTDSVFLDEEGSDLILQHFSNRLEQNNIISIGQFGTFKLEGFFQLFCVIDKKFYCCLNNMLINYTKYKNENGDCIEKCENNKCLCLEYSYEHIKGCKCKKCRCLLKCKCEKWKKYRKYECEGCSKWSMKGIDPKSFWFCLKPYYEKMIRLGQIKDIYEHIYKTIKLEYPNLNNDDYKNNYTSIFLKKEKNKRRIIDIFFQFIDEDYCSNNIRNVKLFKALTNMRRVYCIRQGAFKKNIKKNTFIYSKDDFHTILPNNLDNNDIS